MRNATTPLTDAALYASAKNLAVLLVAAETAAPVTFDYVKRESGEVSERTGLVLGFAGDSHMSNGAVRVDTPAGERTFNLYLMRNLSR